MESKRKIVYLLKTEKTNLSYVKVFSSLSKAKSYLEKNLDQHILFKNLVKMIDDNKTNEKEVEFSSTNNVENMEVELVYCYIDEN